MDPVQSSEEEEDLLIWSGHKLPGPAAIGISSEYGARQPRGASTTPVLARPLGRLESRISRASFTGAASSSMYANQLAGLEDHHTRWSSSPGKQLVQPAVSPLNLDSDNDSMDDVLETISTPKQAVRTGSRAQGLSDSKLLMHSGLLRPLQTNSVEVQLKQQAEELVQMKKAELSKFESNIHVAMAEVKTIRQAEQARYEECVAACEQKLASQKEQLRQQYEAQIQQLDGQALMEIEKHRAQCEANIAARVRALGNTVLMYASPNALGSSNQAGASPSRGPDSYPRTQPRPRVSMTGTPKASAIRKPNDSTGPGWHSAPQRSAKRQISFRHDSPAAHDTDNHQDNPRHLTQQSSYDTLSLPGWTPRSSAAGHVYVQSASMRSRASVASDGSNTTVATNMTYLHPHQEPSSYQKSKYILGSGIAEVRSLHRSSPRVLDLLDSESEDD